MFTRVNQVPQLIMNEGGVTLRVPRVRPVLARSRNL